MVLISMQSADPARVTSSQRLMILVKLTFSVTHVITSPTEKFQHHYHTPDTRLM